MKRFAFACVVALLIHASACSSGGMVDENENVGPGPNLARVTHDGLAWNGHLPYWELYTGGALWAQGSNLPKDYAILVDMTGTPVGAAVSVFGYDLGYNLITRADGVLGPMGIVLQMP